MRNFFEEGFCHEGRDVRGVEGVRGLLPFSLLTNHLKKAPPVFLQAGRLEKAQVASVREERAGG